MSMLSQTLISSGSGFALGIPIGYSSKKVAKVILAIVAVFAGLFGGFLALLSQKNIIVVDWKGLNLFLTSIYQSLLNVTMVIPELVMNSMFAFGGVGVGFYIGWKQA